MRRCRPTARGRISISTACSRRSPASSCLRLRPRRLLGPARRRSPSAIASAGCSSPATPRTAIRPTAASVSTMGWRTRPTSAGSSRRRLQGWGGDGCCAHTARSAARCSRKPPRISSPRASSAREKCSTAHSPETRQGRVRGDLEAVRHRHRLAGAELRAELRRLGGGDRPAGRRVQRARRSSGRGACRASSHAAAAVGGRQHASTNWATGFTLLAFGADDAKRRRHRAGGEAARRAVEGRCATALAADAKPTRRG